MSIAYTDEGLLLRIIILCIALQELVLYFSPDVIIPIPRFYIGVCCVFLLICLKMTIFACIGLWVLFGKSTKDEEPTHQKVSESESDEEMFLSYRYQ